MNSNTADANHVTDTDQNLLLLMPMFREYGKKTKKKKMPTPDVYPPDAWTDGGFKDKYDP